MFGLKHPNHQNDNQGNFLVISIFLLGIFSIANLINIRYLNNKASVIQNELVPLRTLLVTTEKKTPKIISIANRFAKVKEDVSQWGLQKNMAKKGKKGTKQLEIDMGSPELNSITVGMKKEEVDSILGFPTTCKDQGSAQSCQYEGSTKDLIPFIVFKDGKVANLMTAAY